MIGTSGIVFHPYPLGPNLFAYLCTIGENDGAPRMQDHFGDSMCRSCPWGLDTGTAPFFIDYHTSTISMASSEMATNGCKGTLDCSCVQEL